MCGIVGAIYGPNGPSEDEWTPQESAEILFPAVEHRGRDATGVAWYESGDNVHVRKSCTSASESLPMLDGMPTNLRWWIGHVRLATHGSPLNEMNNHPIVHGEWLGIHNGVIANYAQILSKTGRDDERAEVDSEAAIAAVNHYGLENGLKMLRGGAALALVDRKRPGIVHLARTEMSPLWVGISKGGTTYFASEKNILLALDVEWSEAPWPMATFTRMRVGHSSKPRLYKQFKQRNQYTPNWTGRTVTVTDNRHHKSAAASAEVFTRSGNGGRKLSKKERKRQRKARNSAIEVYKRGNPRGGIASIHTPEEWMWDDQTAATLLDDPGFVTLNDQTDDNLIPNIVECFVCAHINRGSEWIENGCSQCGDFMPVEVINE